MLKNYFYFLQIKNGFTINTMFKFYESFLSKKGYNKSYFDLSPLIINNLDGFTDKELVIYHHLGLGDHIICNGLVNKISKNFIIHLAVKKNNFKNVSYLYSENKNVSIFQVESKNEYKEIINYAKQNKLKILKVGFNNQTNDKKNFWNVSFYSQIGFDYSTSYDNFSLPTNINKQRQLENHLKNYFQIENDYILVHNQSSKKKFDLNLHDKNQIEVTKESDLFNNLFLYEILIKNAKEIHCINSSFIHLVERVNTNAILNYHKLWDSNFKLSDKWRVVKYGN